MASNALALVDESKEKPLKLAPRDERANVKPAFWSSKVHGLPTSYKSSAPSGGTVARKRPESAPLRKTSIGRAASTALTKQDGGDKKRTQLQVIRENAEVRKGADAVVAALRKKVIEEFTPPDKSTREQTILIRMCQEFDRSGSGTITRDAFMKMLSCFKLEVKAARKPKTTRLRPEAVKMNAARAREQREPDSDRKRDESARAREDIPPEERE